MGDQVTYISLLTAAIEINNVIGHALEETPLRIKESLLRPSCDARKSLKHGANKQNKPFPQSGPLHISCNRFFVVVINNTHMCMLPQIF